METGEASLDELDHVIDRYHLALDAFMKGDHEPVKQLVSRRDDVTLGNPFGPFAKGWTQVLDAMTRAATHYRDGEAVGFDRIATRVTPELAYIAEVERLRSKVGGGDDIDSLALRVTTIFSREESRWMIIHRHADPITSSQPARSVLSADASSP